MKPYQIEVEWEEPFSLNRIIKEMDDCGKSSAWNGKDYGLYQIDFNLCRPILTF